MLWWLVPAVYLLGWLLAIRPALRWRMLRLICDGCLEPKHNRFGRGHAYCGVLDLSLSMRRAPVSFVPRGAIRERTHGDVAMAVGLAAMWPGLAAVGLAVRSVEVIGEGISRAVPLTAPELERRIREQSAEIARLTEEIDEGKGS